MDYYPAEGREEEGPEQRFRGRLAGGVEEPHLKDYLRVLFMRRWVVIGVAVLVVLSTTLVVMLQTPIYRASCLLLIEPTKIKLTNFQDVYDPTLSQFAGSELARREFMETQFKLLTCRPLMEKVFAQFSFSEMKEFQASKDPMPVFTALFSVSPVRRTRLVEVAFEWRDPRLAAEVVNYLVDSYIQDYRERRLGVTGGGLAALKRKAEDLRPKVAEKAKIFHDFMNEHGLVSLEQSQNIVVERLKGLNEQLTNVQKTRIELQSRIFSIGQALKSKTSLEDMPEVVDSASMRDLKKEWILTKQEISDLSKRFGSNHPQLLSAKAKLKAIRDKIEMDVRSIMSASHLEFQRAKKQEKDILAALNEQQRDVMNLDRLRVEYESLRDAHSTLNRTYQTIIQRIDEIEIASAAGTEEDNIFIIEPAKVPVKKARPKRTQAVLLASILGSMLGLGLAFFLQYLDTTIKTREDVEQAMKLPVLGFVPALQEEELDGESSGERSSFDLLAVDRTRSALAEAFRSLRTSLSFSIDCRGVRSFLVTSASPLEGKSLVSINLAVTFAQAGKRVLLVDADLRKPRIHKTFNLPSSAGLSNLLVSKGNGELGGYAQQSQIENLFILPSGPRPPNPAELLATDRMGELIKEMEGSFDRIIFDTPPVVNVTDASILMHFVGGGIVVVRGFSTQWELAQRASELLQGTQGKMLGAILNNADTPKGAYGYYGYYYYSNYYYYGDSEEDLNGRGKNKKQRKHRSKNAVKRKSDPALNDKEYTQRASKISEIQKEHKNISDSKELSA